MVAVVWCLCDNNMSNSEEQQLSKKNILVTVITKVGAMFASTRRIHEVHRFLKKTLKKLNEDGTPGTVYIDGSVML